MALSTFRTAIRVGSIRFAHTLQLQDFQRMPREDAECRSRSQLPGDRELVLGDIVFTIVQSDLMDHLPGDSRWDAGELEQSDFGRRRYCR